MIDEDQMAPTVHAGPVNGGSLTRCCRRLAFECAANDTITHVLADVTCPHFSPGLTTEGDAQ